MCATVWRRYPFWQRGQVLCFNLASRLVNLVLYIHDIYPCYVSPGHITLPVSREMHSIFESFLQHFKVRSFSVVCLTLKHVFFFFIKFGLPGKNRCWSRGSFLHDNTKRPKSSGARRSDTNGSLHSGFHTSILCNPFICYLVVYHNNNMGCHGLLFFGSAGK